MRNWLFVLVILCAACGSSSPSQPSPQPVAPATPAFQGAWGGTYVIQQATPFPTSGYQHMCSNGNYVAGVSVGVAMTITQNGQSLVGQYTAADTTTTFVSLLNADGTATITGSSAVSAYQYDYTFRLNAPVNSRITGTVALSRTGSAGLVGGCTIVGGALSLQPR